MQLVTLSRVWLCNLLLCPGFGCATCYFVQGLVVELVAGGDLISFLGDC